MAFEDSTHAISLFKEFFCYTIRIALILTWYYDIELHSLGDSMVRIIIRVFRKCHKVGLKLRG